MRAKKFREYNLDQQFLVPPDIRDWVPEDDFSRFIDDLVGALDLSKFEDFHKPGTGAPPYDPAMMLKVVLYCFCTGVFSSRKMERATYKDVGVRFLAANQHPDYSSFSNFAKRHTDALRHVFVQVVTLCRLMGLASLGHVSIDGTVLKANASRSKNVLTEELDDLIATGDALYKQLSTKWEEMDAEEQQAADDIPEKLKKGKSRLDALREAKAAAARLLEEEAKKTAERAKRENAYQEKLAVENPSATEPDTLTTLDLEQDDDAAMTLEEARVRMGWSQRDLAKATAISQARISRFEREKAYPSDEEAELLCNVLEVNHLKFKSRPVRAKKLREEKPSVRRFVNLTDPESYIISRTGKTSEQAYNPQNAVDSDSQIIVETWVSRDTHDRKALVPMLERLDESGLLASIKEISADSGYHSRDNLRCSLLASLDAYIPSQQKRKSKHAKPCLAVDSMWEKMSSDRGKAATRLRAKTVEPPFGRIKVALGFTKFLTRGVENVTREWTLIATAHNILKMATKRR